MRNNVTTAPQVSDTSMLFTAWKESHIGSRQDFVRFISTPSGERTRFLLTVYVTGVFHGSLLLNQVNAE
jgi:hypothetical protein